MNQDITQAELKKRYLLIEETGEFYSYRSKRVVGCKQGCKYHPNVKIRIKRKMYMAHRLVWLYMTGSWPKDEIDHIDGNIENNRFSNLREATRKQNSQNHTKPHRGSRTGVLGVSFHSKTGKYRASLTVDKKFIHLGLHETEDEAHQAYLDEKRKRHSFCTI